MNRIIITGANGLIGSHIAEYFLSKGIHPVCMVRKDSNIDFLRSIRLEIVKCDITDLKNLSSIFNGADFIIHSAAKVSDWGRYDDFINTNVTGTLNVLQAAYLNDIKNVIITGSISCYGEESSSIVKDENYPHNSHYKYFPGNIFPSCLNYYRDTKAEAITKAIEFAQVNSINLTILHPAWVYGEREFHSGFYDFLKIVKDGLFIVPGSKRNKFHTIYARDLAKIYCLAYIKKLEGINEFLAVAPKAEYQYRLFDLFCEKAGYKSLVRIPKQFIYIPAFFTELFYTIFSLKNSPSISRARINTFYDNIEYSSQKITNVLGFTPDYSLEESIENTIRWYKENNYL